MSRNLFHTSILEKNFEFDRNYLFGHLSWLNLAYAKTLLKADIVTADEAHAITEALLAIEQDGAQAVEFNAAREDLVLHVEHSLKERLGPLGGKLHTGRSRNDMGHTLLRMILRDWGLQAISAVENLGKVLLELASKYEATPFPAVTHGQRAQTIPYSHYLLGMAYTVMRDSRRLQHCYREINFCPMGAAALATSVWAVDREHLSDLLAFEGVKINAYDCVSGVDSLLAFTGALRICAINLSRLITDLHMGTSLETGWFSFGDQYMNTSSIMPQKRNPVVLEHLRGRFARLIHECDVVFGMTQGIPYGDVNDIDADLKYPTLEVVTTLLENFALLEEVLGAMKVNEERCLDSVQYDFSNMTELADWLVQEQGVTFRQAHEIVSGIVTRLLAENKTAESLCAEIVSGAYMDVLQEELSLTDTQLAAVLDPKRIIESRDNLGGTSLRRVREQIEDVQKRIDESTEFCASQVAEIDKARTGSYEAIR